MVRFAHEIGHGTWVKSARSSSHEQPVERGEAHRGIDATSSVHRTEARAVPEMSNYHATICQVRIDRAELLGDELV